VQGNEDVFCERCQLFRPIEMYKNLLYSPMNASEEEISSLNARRKKEKQLILDKDLEGKDDKIWFMVSSEWLN